MSPSKASVVLNGETLEAFPLKSGERKWCPLLPLFFKISLEVLANPVRQKKEISIIRIGKEEIKPFLFTNNIVVLCPKTQKSNEELL